MGSRDLPESQDVIPYSLVRKVTKLMFSFLVNRVLGLGVADTQCGLKGFRKEVAKELFSQSRIDDFCFDVEIIYLARVSDKNIQLLPVHLAHSLSSFSLVPTAFKMLTSLIRLSFRILFSKRPR
jgi:dolichyl-phosphate beta-glucosyltransferase